MRINKVLSLSIASLAITAAAGAQTLLTLPDSTTLTSSLSASVSEQATVTVPATISFAVTYVVSDTAAGASAITVTGILLDTGLKQVKISIKAATGSFTGSGTTYSAGDVTWGTGASWTNATETTGTLSTSFQELATCDAGVTGCSTTDAKFKLTAEAVSFSGAKTLTMAYKVESI